MVKVVAMIEKHLTATLAHWKWGITNVFTKGLNNNFRATACKACGYR